MRAIVIGLISGWIALASAAHAPQFYPGIDAFRGQWYGTQLQALHETPLCCDASTRGRTVRFVWLRSFHHPVVIRLTESQDGSWTAVTKIGSGAGGYAPGALSVDEERTISADHLTAMIALFDKTSWFWTTPTSEQRGSQNCHADKDNACLEVHLDGAQWIIEVRDGDRYHYVDRWSPAKGPIRELGDQFIALSQRDLGKVY